MAEPTAFPLCWPSGWKRIPSSRRRDGLFKTNQRPVTVIEACNRVYDQLEMFGGSNVIISSNLLATQDNRPRSVKTVPDDPGVSVYWLQRGAQRCMAIDRYTTVAQNIAAIAATLDAMRAIDRHGGAEILDRAFSGFAALPATAGGDDWFAGCKTAPEIAARYRELARTHHPDQGGDADTMAAINAAHDRAKKATQ